MRIPDALQIDDKLAGSIEDLWQDLQWEEGGYAECLAAGLLHISDLLRSEASRRVAQVREEERRLHRKWLPFRDSLRLTPAVPVWGNSLRRPNESSAACGGEEI